jgi:hypothetical protein
MRKRTSDSAFQYLSELHEGLPCPEGTALLRTFAEKRPSDLAFLEPGDLAVSSNSAFAGIPEWDAFADHYKACGMCNA